MGPDELLRPIWDPLLEAKAAWGLSDSLFFVLGFFIAHETVFVGFNVLLYLGHISGVLQRWKIQPERYPSSELLRKTLVALAVSHVISQPLSMWLLWPVFERNGTRWDSASLPTSWLTIVWQFAFFFIVNETGFYWSHRLLHASEWLYRNVHSRHHMYGAPVGIASEYAHWFEGLVSNGLPTIGGAMILGSHMSVFWLWILLRITLTVENHSGYDLPFSPFHWLPGQAHARAHDYHHSHPHCGNFGASFAFWDWICGTDAEFNRHLKERKSD